MYLKFFLTFLFLFSFSINSSPIFFSIIQLEIKKKINSCEGKVQKNKFVFKEKHFDIKELEKVNTDLLESAMASGKERMEQIKCIRKLNLSESEKLELKKSLEANKEIEISVLEYYNRWLFSFEKRNLMTPMDKKFTSEFLLLKYDLYMLLYNKTTQLLIDEDLAEEDLIHYQEQISSLYHSILKGNFEYYNSITPELRKEIFKKLGN